MNFCLILVILFSVVNGCFCKIQLKKRFVLKTVDAKTNPNTSALKDNSTNFSDPVNKSFSVPEIAKQPQTPKNDEFDDYKIIVNDTIDGKEVRFPKWGRCLIGKIKNLLISFFTEIEQMQTKSDSGDEKLQSSRLNRRGIGDFLKKSKEVLVETSKTAINATKNAMKTVGENVKKVITRNAAVLDAVDVNVIDEDDMATPSNTQSPTCQLHCKGKDRANNTILSDVEIHGDENAKENKETTSEELKGSSNKDEIMEASQLIEEDTKVEYNLKEQTISSEAAVKATKKAIPEEFEDDNKSTVTEKTQPIEGKIKTMQVVEEKTSHSINTNELLPSKFIDKSTKFIDKGTKYYFGDENNFESDTTTSDEITNKNAETTVTEKSITGASPKEQNENGHGEINNERKINKCKGNGRQCVAKKDVRKRSARQRKNASEAIQNKTDGISSRISNKTAINNTLEVSTFFSKNINETTLTPIAPKDRFMYKDWLWQHLEAAKNGSNSTEDFLNRHNFLFNSGGTEKSTTDASENFAILLLKNKTDNAGLAIDLNKMLLEVENLHQNSNIREDLPLKRHRRIKRKAHKPKRKKKLKSTNKVSEQDEKDEEVDLGTEDTTTTTTDVAETEDSTTDSVSNTASETDTTITKQPATPIPQTLAPKSSEEEETDEPSSETTLTEDRITPSPAKDRPSTTQKKNKTSEQPDFDSEEPVINVTVPQTNTVISTYPSTKRGQFEREWNNGGGFRTRPLLLLVTVPSFIGIGVFIIALCFLTRSGGWCCRLFDSQPTSQTSISRDVMESTRRTKQHE